MKTNYITYTNFAKHILLSLLLLTAIATMQAQKTYTKYRTSCPYIITWLVDGVEYTEGNPSLEVYPTQSITALPTPPAAGALGCCSDEFVGWTSSTAQNVSYNDIVTTANAAPQITGNTTFYAVYQRAGGGYITECDIKDNCGEIVVLNNNPCVTSTANNRVKLNIPITLTSELDIPTTITGSSTNSTFEVVTLENINEGNHTVVIEYTPTVTTDGIETATITLQASAGNNAVASFTVRGRHLPSEFVIAAKEGNEWVALTAAVEERTTQKALPIAVDNSTTPTKATVASRTALYQIQALESRYTANGTAVHLHSTQTSKVLNPYASSDTKNDLNTAKTHADAEAQSKYVLFYEWNLVSTDLVHYTITNCNTTAGWENNRVLGYNIEDAKWGTYAEGANVTQDLLLLPVEKAITETTTDIEVMEWGANSMVLRLGNLYRDNLNIAFAGTTTTKSLTRLNSSDLYKVSEINLTSNHCQTMAIYYDDNEGNGYGKVLRKPVIINNTATSQEYCPNCDMVVLNGGKLTAGQTDINYANIYVYPGGKLILDNHSLGAKQQVYLRGGYSWLNPTTYALPEVYLNGDINFSGSTNIIYDYYIQNYKYYQFALPYTVPLAKVTDEAGYDNFPVWVKHYNGALRAANAHATSWDWYYGNNFERGIGYIIAAQPRQIGTTTNRPLSIIRFPLGNDALTQAEPDKSVTTTAHGIEGYKAGTVTANNVGWNFVGNPFLSTWKGDIGHNQLQKHPNEANWDGSYTWVNNKVKYITIMSAESGSDYDQYVASNTELKPFFPFFMQETAAGGSGTINFATGNRVKKAPAAMLADEPREAFVQLEITIDDAVDQTGIFISDKYSDAIDFDDYEKMFGSSTDNTKLWLMHEGKRMAFEAMTESTAAAYTPLGYRAPKKGTYYMDVNLEVSDLTDVEAIYLSDNLSEVSDYDLLDGAYEFESDATTYNDNRFVVRVVLRNEAPGTATDIENIIGIHSDSESPCKFIYQNRMYIMRNGIIYDATGQQVSTINK